MIWTSSVRPRETTSEELRAACLAGEHLLMATTIEHVRVLHALQDLADDGGVVSALFSELATASGYEEADLQEWIRRERHGFVQAYFEGDQFELRLRLKDTRSNDLRHKLRDYLCEVVGDLETHLDFADAEKATGIPAGRVHELLLALRDEGLVGLGYIEGGAGSATLRSAR